MEILGERPVWSMSDSEKLSSLDAVYAEIARLETLALHLIGGLDTTGYAQELGAGTTARLLTLRYRIDAAKARRDVHLANALPKYPAVAAALPDPDPLHTPATADATGQDDAEMDDGTLGGASEAEARAGEGNKGEGSGRGAGLGVLLHPAQAEAIVSALDQVPATVAADDLRVAAEELVELGRTHGPLQLRKAGKLFRDRLDPDGPQPAEDKAYDRESLTLKNTGNGVDFRGFLANENAELLRTVIHAHAKPHKTIDGQLDPRPQTKRQADALTTVLTTANNPTATSTATSTAAAPAAPAAPPPDATARPGPTGDPARDATDAATSPTTDPADTTDTNDTTSNPTAAGHPSATAHPPGAGQASATGQAPGAGRVAGAGPVNGFIPGHGPKAHITITIDFNDLKAATADKIGHLIYGDGLSAATIRRLACDAQVLPIVLGSDSQPLDVGTTVRLATGPMRKALIARDKGCVCCGAPPIYCDAHHVVSWIDGGETKLTNLVLLCKRCHRDLHAGHWDISITNGIVHVSRPTWATPDPVPRGRYRPPTTTPHPPVPTPGSTTPGAPARAWPRDTDRPWITAADTARLNPWGDTPDERVTRAQTPPPAADFDPWGESSELRPAGIPQEAADAGIDPWCDGANSTADIDRQNKPGTDNSTTFAPWGDLAPESDGPSSVSDNRVSPADDGSALNSRTVDPWRDSAELRGPTTTTAA